MQGGEGSKVYELDPLQCPSCGGQIKVVSFIEAPKAIDIIMRYPQAQPQAERPPPCHVAHQELFIAAAERGKYF